MTSCESLVACVLAQQASGWSCRVVSQDTVLLISPLHYSDGDVVEVMVKTVGDEVIVHDGGEIIARLDSVGLRPDRERFREPWIRLLRTHAVDHDRGLILKRSTPEHAAQTVRDMVDALANIDGLRLLAPPSQPLTFPDQLVNLLRAEFSKVQRRVMLAGASGVEHELTAAAWHGERRVYIQAALGGTVKARRSSVDRAYTTFSDINGAVSTDQKLVVLDDTQVVWAPQQVTLLLKVAYVSTWRSRDRWVDFVRGEVPEDSRLLTVGEQPPLR